MLTVKYTTILLDIASLPIDTNADQQVDLKQVAILLIFIFLLLFMFQFVALHMIRALIRNSNLSMHVSSLLEDITIMTITGLRSHIWQIRNVSTVLFGSLMPRVFGPSNVKHEDSDRFGSISPRDFFTKFVVANLPCYFADSHFHRFPRLSGFFNQQLGEITGSNALHPGVFPILSMLIKIQPSSSMSKEETCMMLVFSSVLHALLASPIQAVRSNAAAVIVSMYPRDAYLTEAESELLEITRNSALSQNAIHGRLYKVQAMLKPALAFFPFDTIHAQIIKLTDTLAALLVSSKCPAIKSIILEIIFSSAICPMVINRTTEPTTAAKPLLVSLSTQLAIVSSHQPKMVDFNCSLAKTVLWASLHNLPGSIADRIGLIQYFLQSTSYDVHTTVIKAIKEFITTTAFTGNDFVPRVLDLLLQFIVRNDTYQTAMIDCLNFVSTITSESEGIDGKPPLLSEATKSIQTFLTASNLRLAEAALVCRP